MHKISYNFNFEMVDVQSNAQLMAEIKKLEQSARQYQAEVSFSAGHTWSEQIR